MSENAPKTEQKKISVLNKAVTKQGSNAKITAVIEHCRVWGGALTVFIFFWYFFEEILLTGWKKRLVSRDPLETWEEVNEWVANFCRKNTKYSICWKKSAVTKQRNLYLGWRCYSAEIMAFKALVPDKRKREKRTKHVCECCKTFAEKKYETCGWVKYKPSTQ